MLKITRDIYYVGVNDHNVDLFEGQYSVKNGMSYNSYVIMDEKIAIMDTVDIHFGSEWLNNIKEVLDGRIPDYLIVQHMEPDHSANIENFMNVYQDTQIVAGAKAFDMMKDYFKTDFNDRKIIVKEGDSLSLGSHDLKFVAAPMVHWPEVIMTYDSFNKVLFSADAFGKFGALDIEEDWLDEARRYYIGIVGKFGMQVQALLKKASALDIEKICPLHGPVLEKDLGTYLNLYQTWSSYEAETEGVVIAYTSVYGHTKEAVEKLTASLKDRGVTNYVVYDLARCDLAEAVSKAFQYSKLVLATTTYNNEIFPFMREYIHHLTERGYQKRQIGLIENGSWAPMAAKIMTKMLESCKDLKLLEPVVQIWASLSEKNMEEIQSLADELCQDQINSCLSK